MKALLAALQRMAKAADGPVAASQFTAAQRKALDQFIQQTHAIACRTSGRGITYQVVQPQVIEQHLRSLSPGWLEELSDSVPNRAANIAAYRHSKGGGHRHAAYYLLMRACGGRVQWCDAENQLDLSEATARYGVAALAVEPSDAWCSAQPLWLVENQALFDRLDWLPNSDRQKIGLPHNGQASVHWYRGQINNNLLDWLGASERVPEVILFPDYDGVGLRNYARLHQRLGDRCSLWLMPDWQPKLKTFGSDTIWRDTKSDFDTAVSYLSQAIPSHTAQGAELHCLITALRTEGAALEQEAIWL
ncbi:DUF7281 domain-containing protein [Thalassolituus marinus]|uniref:DUF7281 domain-containing protein n=1 Tax=Thalassolituus marinus TaxID=671053 RepID=A0ABS7ZRK6_9GAMM|nr:hypothetical protein [Thalassolituus marinus]MCA6063767.1 hypothetical protein [Thalassolituus marinus]